MEARLSDGLIILRASDEELERLADMFIATDGVHGHNMPFFAFACMRAADEQAFREDRNHAQFVLAEMEREAHAG